MPKKIQLVFWKAQAPTQEPYTTSEVIAEAAGMNRRTVNRLIQTHKADLEEFGRVRFEITPLKTKGGVQSVTVYHLNEQQATLLMTYARNTETVRAFKKELVKQFYAMRSLLLERNSPIWQDTRALTKAVRKQETDAIRELVEYATGQGSKHAVRYYTSISRIANKAAGITDRDRAHVEELTALMLIERVIAEEIRAGIAAGKPYKEIYTAIQQRLLTFGEITGTSTLCLTPHNAPHGAFAVGECTDITETENEGIAQLTGGKEE